MGGAENGSKVAGEPPLLICRSQQMATPSMTAVRFKAS